MIKALYKIFAAGCSALSLFFLIAPSAVSAQQCASTRIINQWACVTSQSGACASFSFRCSDGSTCLTNAAGERTCASGNGSCTQTCEVFNYNTSCNQTGSQTVSCNQSTCSATATLLTCSGSGSTAGSCSESTSVLSYQCYVNNTPSSPDPGGGGGGSACNWCTNQAQCASSGGSWSDSGGYCSVAGDGCCATSSSGGGDPGGGDGLPPCPSCGNRFCGQNGCSSDRHKRPGAVPVWDVTNQGTIVIPVGTNQVPLTWRDPSGLDSCSADREGNFDLRLYEINGWGGVIMQTITDTRVSRSSVAVPNTANSNRENGQMRYNFFPTGRYYRALVRSVNTLCSSNNPALSDWATVEFQVHAQQTGKIFLDVNGDAVVDANGRCVSPSLNEADANTHLMAQRSTTPWNSYTALDGFGWTYRSGWPEVVLAPLGSPFTPGTRFGSAASMVDRNLSTYWASDARGEDTHHRKVGINFTSPQEDIQVVSIHEYSDGNNIRTAPHTGVNIDGVQAVGTSAPGKSWAITPGMPLSYIRFTSNTTGFTDSQRWGVAEIRAWRNPNPVPRLQTVSGSEIVGRAGWTNQGGYTINSAVGVASRIEFDLGSDEFTCSCPEGCQYNVANSNANMHFFINVKANPWFQLRDGGVAAYGTNSVAIVNPIPEQCTAARNCTPALVVTPNSNAPVTMTGGGTVDVSDAVGQQTTGLDDENKNWLARLSATPARQDFAYFRRIYKFPTANLQNDFELNFNNATKPSEAPRNGVSAYYQSGDMAINSPWAVNSGESYVILVDGNLNVNSNITVAEGGFLAFVVKGSVTFNSALGSSDIRSQTPVVEGVFIADDQIILPASRLKFVGAGTFVGWNGFLMQRNYETTDNWSAPTELFIYRADFLRNAPAEMKTPRYEWNEVNP